MAITTKTVGNLTYVHVPKADFYDGNGYKIFQAFDAAIAVNPDTCPITNTGLNNEETYYQYKIKNKLDHEFMFCLYNGYTGYSTFQGIANITMSKTYGSANYSVSSGNDWHFYYNKDFFCAYTDRGYWGNSGAGRRRNTYLIASKMYNVDTEEYEWQYMCVYTNSDTTTQSDNNEYLCTTGSLGRPYLSDKFGLGCGSYLSSCKNAFNVIYPLNFIDLPYVCPFFYKIGITSEDNYMDMDRKFSAKLIDINGVEHPCAKLYRHAIMGDIEIPD